MPAMELAPLGIFTAAAFDAHPVPAVLDAARELDELGFGAVWIPETIGREVMANSALLLGATRNIVVATGIANLWARDPVAMNAGAQTLGAAHPGRFLLGIGVSHQQLVEGRGYAYDRPLSTMRRYLDGMDAAPYRAVPAEVPPVRLLAALGPKMLRLAAERAGGAVPYLVPVEHTALARDILGPDRLLCPEQAVVLESDAERGREIARGFVAGYMRFANYVNNLRRLGFGDEDFTSVSDRLVDALVAVGDEEAVRRRVQEHRDAGADHVAVQVLTGDQRLPLEEWRRLAGLLGG
jgi:probable F420-dependent oxidoreductase